MSPFSLPLFPLPNVVLFPNVFLPLHIFEPRYRQMTKEALTGDRIIGMVLLRPGYEADYEGAPAIYQTGCSGLITHAEELEDGRYNLVLRGIEKFSVQHEEAPAPGRLYRSAVVTPLGDETQPGDRDQLRSLRQHLTGLLSPLLSGSIERQFPEAMPDADLVNALAQYLEFDPLEKLALLQGEGPLSRCRLLIELLEMKSMSQGSGNGDQGSGVLH